MARHVIFAVERMPPGSVYPCIFWAPRRKPDATSFAVYTRADVGARKLRTKAQCTTLDAAKAAHRLLSGPSFEVVGWLMKWGERYFSGADLFVWSFRARAHVFTSLAEARERARYNWAPHLRKEMGITFVRLVKRGRGS